MSEINIVKLEHSMSLPQFVEEACPDGPFLRSSLPLKDSHPKFCIGPFCFPESFLNCSGTCENHSEASVPLDFRFSEKAQLNTALFKDFLQIVEFHLVSITLHYYGLGCAWPVELDFRNRPLWLLRHWVSRA